MIFYLLAGMVGMLLGVLVMAVAAASSAATREEEFKAQLSYARSPEVYDWAGEVGEDALAFSRKMIDELVAEVGDLRAVALEAAAWLETRPDATEGDAATASALRGVLEDAVPR